MQPKKSLRFLQYFLPTTYLGLWVFLYFLPRSYFHVAGNGFEGFFLFTAFFLILPYLLYLSLGINGIEKVKAKNGAYSSIFLMLPFCFLISAEDHATLAEHSLTTKGTITKAWMAIQQKKKPIWTVQASYQVNQMPYQTASQANKEKTLQLGDTVTIIYVNETPQISEIQELQTQ
ncbi:MAG: hypothetical protein AB8G15_09030 [Saprospiraceae bacterium]